MSQRTMLDFLNSTLFKFFTDSEVKKYLYRAIGGFFISKSEKGAANGVATLDGNQKVPTDQLLNSIVEYLGLWYPSTNNPSLADGDGNAGDTYRVADNKSGTISGLNDPSMVDFLPGQYILYSGAVWQKSVSTGIPLSYLDTDGTLSANSDTKVASQKATKTYIDTGLSNKQNSLGFTPENVANKATNLTTPDNTKYPTTQAVSTALNGKQDSLGFTPENVLNKSTIAGNTTSTTIYPHAKGVVDYITSLGYLTTSTAASTYVSLSGSYSNPSWITSLAWSKISSTPTTLAGYGITDAITASTAASTYLPLTGGTLTGAVISSVNGATGAPALRFTGNLATSINDKPLFAIETNGSSGSWGADGTVIGVNIANNIGVNTTRLIDLQYNGSSQFYVQRNGNVVSSTSIQAGSTSRLGWISNTALWSVSNGDLSITATNGTTSGSISLYSLGQNGTTISSDYERMRIFYLSGSGLTFSANVSLGVITTGNVVSITNSGSGYPPSITFITSVTGNNGTGATATITTNSSGAVTAVSIITGGTGYNNGNPTANFGISSGFYNFSSSAIGTGTTRNIAVSVAGIQSCTFSNSGITVPQGSATAASINFGTANTGIYNDGLYRFSFAGTPVLSINNAGAIFVQNTSYFAFGNRSKILCSADGNIQLQNNANNDFNLLQFGGTTSLFPALKRSGSTIMVRTADDALAANIDCNSVVSNSIYNRTNANNSLLTFSDNGLIASRNIADANPALIINQSNLSSTGNVQNWQYNSSNVATLERSGGINLGSSSTSNARITIGSALGSVSQIGILNTTHSTGQNFGVIGFGIAQAACTYTSTTSSGTIGTAGVNTFATPTLAASNATTLNNAATFYIAGPPTAGTNVSILNNYALHVGSGVSIFEGGFATINGTTGIASSNLYVAPGNVSGGTSNSSAQISGSSSVAVRALFNGTFNSTIGTNNSYGNMIIGKSPITTAASGTHSILANLAVNPIGTVTSGGAAVTNTASLYIDGAGTGGVNNYALFVAAGLSKFDGGHAFSTIRISASGTTLTNSSPSLLLSDTSGGSFSINLPASPTIGRVFMIKHYANTGTTTVNGNGKTIDGSSTISLSTQYSLLSIMYTSEADWVIIGRI